jgi:hypothetical protein
MDIHEKMNSQSGAALLRRTPRVGTTLLGVGAFALLAAAGSAAPVTANAAPSGCAATGLGHISIGSATCAATGFSMAIAIGPNTSAISNGIGALSFAWGDTSKATATGNLNIAAAVGSHDGAEATAGNLNVAVAAGDTSGASATLGSGNTAVAFGRKVGAVAQTGNGHTAFAVGHDSGAAAEGGTRGGNRNTAVVIGANSGAVAQEGGRNRAFTFGNNSASKAANGDDNSATTVGDNSSATATGHRQHVTTIGNNKHRPSAGRSGGDRRS